MMSWLTGSGADAKAQGGRGAPVVKAAPSQPWAATFNPIAAKQVKALRSDASVSAELRTASMNVVYRTWTDIKRAKNSSLGSNITDGQFFAIAPEGERAGKDYLSLPSDQYVCFPAVRPPNYTDEVDIETVSTVSFKAKNRDGTTETVTLAEFLKRIGDFISDLPRGTDWSDDADAEPMQAASQFSVLPCPADRTEIGVAMFGYQCKNLHVIVCPDGTLGWAPEGRGSKRIFLRNPSDHAELRAVALVPEDRAEVQAGFFKPEEPDETIEQEAERYKEVENQLLHIQIAMDLPREHKPAALSGFVPMAPPSDDSFPMADWSFSMSFSMAAAAPMAAAVQSASSGEESEDDDREDAYGFEEDAGEDTLGPEAELVDGDEADLNLARVQLGSVIGTRAEDDKVPKGAKRAPGVSVRITRMGYGVASDGAITAPRVRRFIKQMSFERRARALAHGSLVTGEGTWSAIGPPAPITLPPLPSSIEALSELFVQFPTQDVQKFATGGPDAAIKLGVGEEMCVPGVFTLRNIGGTIVATRAASVSYKSQAAGVEDFGQLQAQPSAATA